MYIPLIMCFPGSVSSFCSQCVVVLPPHKTQYYHGKNCVKKWQVGWCTTALFYCSQTTLCCLGLKWDYKQARSFSMSWLSLSYFHFLSFYKKSQCYSRKTRVEIISLFSFLAMWHHWGLFMRTLRYILYAKFLCLSTAYRDLWAERECGVRCIWVVSHLVQF